MPLVFYFCFKELRVLSARQLEVNHAHMSQEMFFILKIILGMLYDLTGKYEPAFIVAGVAIALSGLILYFIPPLQRYVAAKEARKNAIQMREF